MNSHIFRMKQIFVLVKVMSEMCSRTIVLFIRLIFYTDCTLFYITPFFLVFIYCRRRSDAFIFYLFI